MAQKIKFVQIGERVDGRIRKNEQYTIDKFVSMVLPDGAKVVPTMKKLSFFDRIKSNKVETAIKNAQDVGYRKGYNDALKEMKNNIRKSIEKDTFGKK